MLELYWDEIAPDEYKGASFELYLEHEDLWTLDDFRLLQEAVFDYPKQCDQYGIGTVAKISKSEKPEEVFKKIEKRQSKRKTPLPADKIDEIIEEALKKGG